MLTTKRAEAYPVLYEIKLVEVRAGSFSFHAPHIHVDVEQDILLIP